MLRKTLPIVAFMCFVFSGILFLPVAGGQRPQPRPSDPLNPIGHPTPGPCCGKKPPLTRISSSAYASFTGQIAVATHHGDPVVAIWDLKNQATAPLGTVWNSSSTPATSRYDHPAWVTSELGDVFGLTLDSTGNIYVASTRIYTTNNIGSPLISPGTTPGKGDIYKLDAFSGQPTRFVQTLVSPTFISSSPNKIPNMGAGLGNITYSCEHNSLYVSNFETGEIYRINSAGQIQSVWDHGLNLATATPSRTAILDSGTNGFTALGRRPWAVQVRGNELFYSVWTEDAGRQDPLNANEIWSIGLTGGGTGNFTGNAKLVISVPPWLNFSYSNPVADISFNAAGNMLLAERSMNHDNNTQAHQSRVLEYKLVSGIWTPEPVNKFGIGGTNPLTNAAGGCDYDYGVVGRVWATSDAIITSPIHVYGLQGTPAIGGGYLNSILIDFNNNVTVPDKSFQGDVEIPCPATVQSSCIAEFGATTVCPGQTTTFTDLSSGASSWNWSFGDGGTSTQQNPSHVYTAAGSYTVTLSVSGGACTVTHSVVVSPAPPAPVINGPATTCQSGTYSVVAPTGSTISWSVTNGSPSSTTGSSINVTWNSTGNGLVAVTVTNPQTCCRTTSQLIVHACDSATCCEGINVNAQFSSFSAAGGNIYTLTPLLTAGPNLITHVSAAVISTSLTFTPSSCGTAGPANSYVTGVGSPAGFSSSLPVQFSREVEWNSSSSAGVNLSGGLTFPINIQFPAPPTSILCRDNLSLCIKYTFSDVNCHKCEIIRCYGPFARSGGTSLPSEENLGGAIEFLEFRIAAGLPLTDWF